MGRPFNMTLLPEHPAIVSIMEIRTMYEKTGPCSPVQCPGCAEQRWYPWHTLRQMLKRGEFTGYCNQCYAKHRDKSFYNNLPRRKRRGATGRHKSADGYVYLTFTAIPESETDTALFDAMKPKRGIARVAEHRFVLAKALGRALLPNESAHHKNGRRDDNRLENLELWVSSQPSGQRAEDLVTWAHNILDLYGPLFPVK